MVLVVNLSQWERLLKRDLNITSTSTHWKTARSSPTPFTRLWLFSASPKKMCTWIMFSEKIKKISICLFLLKNKKSHSLCGFFSSCHWELVISIYPCLKTRAEIAWDTISPKIGTSSKFCRLKILRKQIHPPIPIKGGKLWWQGLWLEKSLTLLVMLGNWMAEQTQPFCIAAVSSFEIISKSVRI